MDNIQSFPSYEIFYDYFSNLSIEEQAGFFLWPSVKGSELTSEERKLFLQFKPSGVVLFKRNLLNIEQAKSLISDIRFSSVSHNVNFEKNFIVSVDEEGGRVSRLPLNVDTKPVLEFVKNHDKQGLKNQVFAQTNVAHTIGVNCFLAPVLDVFTEPKNAVIGDRSFGHTPEEVCEYAEVVYDMLEKENIFSCGKHFPGHGNTTTDSHVDFAVNNASKEIIERREWVPFIHFIDKNIPMMMAAHVAVPNLAVDQNNKQTPATLNSHILNRILRNQLGFQGLILSDDLRMGAIKKYYEKNGITKDYLAYASIDALYAGCDILLSCDSIVDEQVIFHAIATKLQQEKVFFDLCCEKAYRQTLLFSSHFMIG